MTAGAIRRRARLLIAAIVAFAALVGAAMAAYHGGSHLEPLAPHYEPFRNYLSDLGATVTYSGRPNGLPRTLFVTASVLVGGALAWSAPVWRVWNARHRADAAVDVTTTSAVLAGIGFAAVGLTPQNRFLGAHVALTEISFSLLLAFVGALAVVQLRNGAPRRLWIPNVTLLTVLGLYVVLVVTGSGPGEATTIRHEITAQKLVVAVTLLDVALQARGLVRRSVREGAPTRRRGQSPKMSLSERPSRRQTPERPPVFSQRAN